MIQKDNAPFLSIQRKIEGLFGKFSKRTDKPKISSPNNQPLVDEIKTPQTSIEPSEPMQQKEEKPTIKEREEKALQDEEKVIYHYENNMTDEQRIEVSYININKIYRLRSLSSDTLNKEAEAYSKELIEKHISTNKSLSYYERDVAQLAIIEYLLTHNHDLSPEWQKLHARGFEALSSSVDKLFPTTPDKYLTQIQEGIDSIQNHIPWINALRTYVTSKKIKDQINPYTEALKQLPTLTYDQQMDFRQKSEHEDKLMEVLYRMSARHILFATNAIRTSIFNGDFESMTPEAAFRHIHEMHIGKTAKEHLTALASDTDNPQMLNSIALQLGSDLSLITENANRISQIEWNNIRGVLGIPFLDLPAFSQKVFGEVEGILERKDQLTSPDTKLAASIFYSTLIDLIHLKIDGNGRSSEDFMIWMQRKIKGEPVFLSQNGLRAVHAEKFVPDEQKQKIQQQRERIEGRGDIVLGIRRTMYEELKKYITQKEGNAIVEKFGITSSIYYRDYATTLFYKLLETGKNWIDALENGTKIEVKDEFSLKIATQLEELLSYFKNSGIKTYEFLDPESILTSCE